MRERDNLQLNRRLRDNLVKIENKPRPKKRRNWPLFLLVVIVIIAAVLATVLTYYDSVRDHYQEFIYTPTITTLPMEEQDTSYILNVIVSNQEEEGVQVESAVWAQLYQLDPTERVITKYVLPLNADYEDGGVVYNVQPYAEVGVNGLMQQFEDILGIVINAGAVTRLDYIRDFTDMFTTIELESSDSDYDDILLEQGSTTEIPIEELSGLQVQQLFQFYQGETDISSLQARDRLLMEVYDELWSWDMLLDLNDIIEASERFVDSSINFPDFIRFLLPPYSIQEIRLDDLSSISYDSTSSQIRVNLPELEQEISNK